MKSTGVVRKIDELGRIVIPKEIRKVLNINSNDDLEIKIENNGIVLKKYSFMNSKLRFYNDIIDAFSKVFEGKLLITDKEKILTKEKYENILINDFLANILISRKEYKSTSLEKLEISNLFLEGYFFIKPIIVDSDAIGLIIYNDSKKIDDYEEKYILVLYELLSKI